jgi:uncharacterized membrane protein
MTKSRVESIDLLKGVVMIVMALDHIRDYFHYSAFFFDPSDPTQSTIPIFFTRFITHFCAPSFSFLAGLSAFMAGKRKTKNELSLFLLKRGIWLILLEMTVVNFGWYFDVHFNTLGFLVIAVLGISMIVLAALIHLPKLFILLFGCLSILGHNMLENIHFDNIFWWILHERFVYKFSATSKFYFEYHVIPWSAVMALGYYFGSYYDNSFDVIKRKKIFNIIGISAILVFITLRWTNIYGDPNLFKHYGTLTKDLMSFLNLTKYPPSLLYLLVTLGFVFLFLANTENLKGRIVNFFSTFGRVPFFYYIIHIYLIHILALFMAELSGFGWEKMILSDWVSEVSRLKGFGFSLSVVYIIWIFIIAFLYPFCKKFDKYKQTHKDKWWLSYL